MRVVKTIILDCERMKYNPTGLYHFCLHLGQALLYMKLPEESLVFYTDKTNKGIFGPNEKYLLQQPLHKIFLPSVKKYNVWHTTHQDSMYQPQNGKIPVVLTIHDLNFLKGNLKNHAKQHAYLKRLQQKINKADHVVAISNYVLNDLKEHINIGNTPVSVIYNGCNITPIPKLLAPEHAPQHPFLFTIGTITEKKNFHVLPQLLVNNTFELLIAGVVQDKNYQQVIMAEATRLGVSDRVHFVGAISENDKQWYYKHCSAFVFPSIAEGFGLPVIEAMAFGKPVFLSTHTSLPEIGGEHAFYFSGFDQESMQEVLHKGLAAYKQNNNAAAIIQHAQQFNWRTAAEKYLEIYRSFY